MSQESDSEVPPEELLIHGRSKRATAGNRLAFLLQHLEDEDVRNDLLAEDENDQQDYEISDAEDVAFGSSDDSDDEGPPKQGQEEDLAGEKELQKQERVEARRKRRKAQDLTGVNPLRKRARLDLPTARQPRPRKKSERISWLPTAEDAPTRQSNRRQTVANKEQTEAKLKESQKRSEKAHELMKVAAEKKAAVAGPALTQADRMAKALKVEKENSRSLNRWEKAEVERQLAQQRRLEALRDRQLEGPVIRYWSGSVIWEGEKIKVKRVHQPKVDVVEDTPKNQPNPTPVVAPTASGEEPAVPGPDLENAEEVSAETAPAQTTSTDEVEKEPGETLTQEDKTQAKPEETATTTEGPEPQASSTLEDQPSTAHAQDSPIPSAPSQEPAPFLDGIHYWASQSPEATAQKPQESSDKPTEATPAQINQDPIDSSVPPETQVPTPQHTELPPPQVTHSGNVPHEGHVPDTLSAPIIQNPMEIVPTHTTTAPDTTPYSMHTLQVQPPQHEAPHSTTQSTTQPQTQTEPAPPPAAAPLLREQAQRSLIMLEAFPELETIIATSKKSASASASAAISSILMPEATPNLSAAELKYLTSKSAKKKEFLPPPPARPVCAITAKPARFRDPKTGTAYKDLEAYKALQRVIAGGTAWSSVLDCWTGIVGEGPIGRVAKGVPDCFWNGKREDVVKSEEAAPVETLSS